MLILATGRRADRISNPEKKEQECSVRLLAWHSRAAGGVIKMVTCKGAERKED